MTPDACAECGAVLGREPGDPRVVDRESTGFGHHNEVIRQFCGRRCRALWHGTDPVLAVTRQVRLDELGAVDS